MKMKKFHVEKVKMYHSSLSRAWCEHNHSLQ